MILALFDCAKSTPCENVVLEEAPAPGGRLKAVVFERRCPDNGQRSTQISILKRDEKLPDGNGNIFAADAATSLKVRWPSEKKLSIYGLGDLTKATRLEKAGDVTIEYVQMMDLELTGPLDVPAGPGATPYGH